MLVRQNRGACGRETVANTGRCEWCGMIMDVTERPPRSLGPLPTVPEFVTRNRRWANALYVLGGIFLLIGAWGIIAPWTAKSVSVKILISPIAWLFAVCPLSIAAILLGVGASLAKRVRAATVCRYCRRALQLVAQREGEPSETGPGYTEYVCRCTHCGEERVVVDA